MYVNSFITNKSFMKCLQFGDMIGTILYKNIINIFSSWVCYIQPKELIK